MGNCLRSNKVLSEDHNDAPIPKEEEEEAVKEETQQAICSTSASSTTLSKLESAKEGKMKKVVRFKLPEDEEEEDEEEDDYKENVNNSSSNGGDSTTSGVVRIKLVLTREELKQVVNFMNASEDDHDLSSSSLQQLLSVIKSRGQSVSETGTGSWRPVLESIGED